VESPIGDNKGGAYAGVRTYRYLYVEYRETGELELYDLKRDPYELRSMDWNPAYDGVRERLARLLGSMRRCVGRTACNRKPRVRLAFAAKRGPGGCVAGPLRVRVGGPDRADLRLAELFVGTRRVAADGRAPFLKRVAMYRLPRSSRGKLRVRATMVDGRMVTVDRRVRRCL
jgi:hypothetical protein